MRVTVVGTGYVGLVSGVCLSAKGHNVTCVDVNPDVVKTLNAGKPHIYERGLDELMTQCIAKDLFRATADLKASLKDAEGVIVAVGTPSENGVIDLSYIKTVAREIGAFLKTTDRFLPIIIKSTVIAGTADTTVREEIEKSSGKKMGEGFGLGMNPEFLREGDAISDFMEPDRIVLGHEDQKTLAFLQALYAPWDCDKLCVNTRTAELIKYSNNAMLALQISAVNEIANVASAVGGIDILEVMRGVHLDKRWNPLLNGKRAMPHILTYLVPGCGFGGSCFPKDVQALRSQGEQVGLKMDILNAILNVNEAQPSVVCNILERELGSLSGKKVLILGLAFKPETDDVRYSASLKIAAELLDKGSTVRAHDPIATEPFKKAFGPKSAQIAFVEDWKVAARDAEIIIVATKWDAYSDLKTLNVSDKAIFDARRLLSPAELKGANYLSIGRRGI